jgi:hypothetical protein
VGVGPCQGGKSGFLFYEGVPQAGFPNWMYTANEGPMRIQFKCLVPIDVFPEIKLLFPKQNYNVQSPSSYTHISVRDLYISRIGLPIPLQENMWTDLGNTYINRKQTHERGNWD